MKDEITLNLEEDMARAEKARQVVDNVEYKRAIMTMKADLISKFEKTKFKDTDERDEIWRKLQAINWLDKTLEHVMRTGQLAEKTLLQRIKDKLKS